MSNTFVGALKYKNFFKLWLSQITSQVALNMLHFAILLHLYDMTKSTITISFVLIASAIPSIVFGPFSGVFADRINLKKILTVTNFLRFLAVLLLFVSKDNVLALLEIIFIISTITQFFAPAELSSIPMIVPKEKLISANSVAMTTMYLSLLIGYSIAGPIMSIFSVNWLFLFCALLYLIATLAVNSMTKYDDRENRPIILTTLAGEMENIWKSTKEGASVVIHHKKILSTMIRLALGWAVLGSFIVLLPAFGESVLKISANIVGPAIVVPAGLGMLIGAMFLEKKKKYNLRRAIEKGFFLIGVASLFFSLYRLYDEAFFARPLMLILPILIGFGCSCVYISAQTYLHIESSEENRGRIFGFNSMLINFALSVPALFVGVISDITSPFFAMLLISVAVLIYGTALLFEDSK